MKPKELSLQYLIINPFILIFVVAVICLPTCYGQSTYQKLFAETSAGDNLVSIMYGTGHDSEVLLLGNACLIELNSNTGLITYAKSISIGGEKVNIKNAHRKEDALYIAASFRTSGRDTACILKYSITAKAFIWAKKLQSLPNQVSLSSITGDDDGNLYIAGITYDTVSRNNPVALKLDTNGVLSWIKCFGSSSDYIANPTILFNGSRELFLSFTDFQSGTPFGNSNIVRMNNTGGIINATTITTTSGPRINNTYSGIVDHRLCSTFETIQGPSDPGPLLFRVVDSALMLISEKSFGGVTPNNVYTKESTILISGLAPVSSGVPGFRSIRLDKNLNVVAARHFNKIPTFSIAAQTYSLINSANHSVHFFKPGIVDSFHLVKTDTNEMVYCSDTFYSPPSLTPFSYSDTLYSYVNFPISGSFQAIIDDNLLVSDISIATKHQCDLNSNGISEIEKTQQIALFPNPANSEINIEGITCRNFTLTILSIDGKTIMRKNNEKQIYVSALVPGLYIIQVRTENNIFTGKFLKN